MEIEKFVSLLEEIASYFHEVGKIGITASDIEDALYIRLSDKYGFEWRGSLWDVEISKKEAIAILKDFDFSILTNSIETDRDILPSSMLLQYKVRIKSGGIIWVIHLYDEDPFPSSPHAHQLENNIKLDLSTGKCYKIRNHIHTITKKDLLDIRQKAEKVFKGELPPLLV